MSPFFLFVVLGAAEAHIEPHAGYGGPGWFRLSGRVLEGRAPAPADPRAGRLANARDTLVAMESDEIEGAAVSVVVGGREFHATTNADGVFLLEGRDLALAPGVLGAQVQGPAGATARAPIHVMDCPNGVAVVSDIDDTVVQTHVTDKARMLATVITSNAAQLEPAPGMAAMYRAGQSAGVCGFFYVSSSPQNFYPRLAAFLEGAGYPAGPMFLKNFGEDALSDHGGYKTERIEALLAGYPATRFVLIGDSGEQDPPIYRAVRAALPERITAILIREVPDRPVSGGDVVVLSAAGADTAALARAATAR